MMTDIFKAYDVRGKYPLEINEKLAYDLGLIDTNLPFEKARERYFINDRALKYADSPDFSLKIREND